MAADGPVLRLAAGQMFALEGNIANVQPGPGTMRLSVKVLPGHGLGHLAVDSAGSEGVKLDKGFGQDLCEAGWSTEAVTGRVCPWKLQILQFKKKIVYNYRLCFGKKENNGTISREMETHRCIWVYMWCLCAYIFTCINVCIYGCISPHVHIHIYRSMPININTDPHLHV